MRLKSSEKIPVEKISLSEIFWCDTRLQQYGDVQDSGDEISAAHGIPDYVDPAERLLFMRVRLPKNRNETHPTIAQISISSRKTSSRSQPAENEMIFASRGQARRANEYCCLEAKDEVS